MFEVNCIYLAEDSFHRRFYLWVLQVATSKTALRGVVYDTTYSRVARRWFRVSLRGKFFVAHASSDLCFHSYDLVKDSGCIPPLEVLYYFRDE